MEQEFYVIKNTSTNTYLTKDGGQTEDILDAFKTDDLLWIQVLLLHTRKCSENWNTFFDNLRVPLLIDKDVNHKINPVLTIQKIKLTTECVENIDPTEELIDLLISRHLSTMNWTLSYFWDEMRRRGCSGKINYVAVLNRVQDFHRKYTLKEARRKLKHLGVKYRSYTEHEGVLGFYSDDDAMKAKLTLDLSHFIDINEIRARIFETCGSE